MKRIGLIILFTFIFLLFSPIYAQIPHLINYQGKLTDTDGNPVSDGTYSIVFRIYDADSGGNLLWEETQSILAQKGIFSCLLGGVVDLGLPFDKPYWLAIKVGDDEEMTPRQQIASVGYAIRAKQANSATEADTASSASNSDMIDGYDTTVNASASKIPILNTNGYIAPFFETYDSGWFACSTGGTYTKTHNLGTTKILPILYWASSSGGANMSTILGATHPQLDDENNGNIQNITSTTLTVQAGRTAVHVTLDDRGISTLQRSGYYRVIVLALE